MRIKDFQQHLLLSGQIPGAIEEDAPVIHTHIDEQNMLREEFKKMSEVKEDGGEQDGSESGGLFSLKKKTQLDATKEEEAYKNWLLQNLDDKKTKGKSLRSFVDPSASHLNHDDGEKFLME